MLLPVRNLILQKILLLNFLLGGNYRKSQQEYVTASGQDFAIPFLYNIGNLINKSVKVMDLYHSEY